MHTASSRNHGSTCGSPTRDAGSSDSAAADAAGGSASCGRGPASCTAARVRRPPSAAGLRPAAQRRDGCPRRQAAARRARDRPRARLKRSGPGASARVSHGRSTSADGDVAQACVDQSIELGPRARRGEAAVPRRMATASSAACPTSVVRGAGSRFSGNPAEHVLGDRDLASGRQHDAVGVEQAVLGAARRVVKRGQGRQHLTQQPDCTRRVETWPLAQRRASTVDRRSPATSSETRASCGSGSSSTVSARTLANAGWPNSASASTRARTADSKPGHGRDRRR